MREYKYHVVVQGARREDYFKVSTSRMIPRDTKSPQQEVSESLTEQLDSAVKALVDSTSQAEIVNNGDMGDPSRLTEEELAELEAAKDKSKRAKRG